MEVESFRLIELAKVFQELAVRDVVAGLEAFELGSGPGNYERHETRSGIVPNWKSRSCSLLSVKIYDISEFRYSTSKCQLSVQLFV